MRRSALLILTHCFLSVFLSPTLALADARQDVREASQRCDRAGISDDRLWLECYYGAAQAVRGQLNLPPAPASQQRLVPPASAKAPQSTGAATPGVSNQVRSAAARGPAPLPRRSGFFGALLGEGRLVRADQRIETMTTNPKTGLSVVLLETGERWEVIYGDGDPDWRGNPVANITEGAMGTYNMKLIGDPVLYKVRRLN